MNKKHDKHYTFLYIYIFNQLFKKHKIIAAFYKYTAHLHCEVRILPFYTAYSDEHLVFWVGCVNSLTVFAGLQQDVDGIQLQENLTGHAVKEGDIGQGCRGQEEDFTTGGALAQLWENKARHTKYRGYKQSSDTTKCTECNKSEP